MLTLEEDLMSSLRHPSTLSVHQKAAQRYSPTLLMYLCIYCCFYTAPILYENRLWAVYNRALQGAITK